MTKSYLKLAMRVDNTYDIAVLSDESVLLKEVLDGSFEAWLREFKTKVDHVEQFLKIMYEKHPSEFSDRVMWFIVHDEEQSNYPATRLKGYKKVRSFFQNLYYFPSTGAPRKWHG